MEVFKGPISDFGKKDIIVIKHDDSIWKALTTMVNNRFRRLPVIDQSTKLIGMITATDIIKILYEENDVDFLSNKISTIMSKNPIQAKFDDNIGNTITTMYNSDISGVPVLKDDEIISIFTEKDILLIDKLWEQVPNDVITSETGIGNTIDEDKNVVTEEFTIWQIVERIVKSGVRQQLLRNSHLNHYIGLITIMRTLGSLIGDDGVRRMTFLSSASVHSLVRRPLLQKGSPIMISSIRMWMNSRGIEAVPIFYRNSLAKLVTENEMIGLVASYIKEN